MKEVLILGYPSDGVDGLDRERVRSAARRLVSLSLEVSEFLHTHRLPHVSIQEYLPPTGWASIHDEIARVLLRHSESKPSLPGDEWLDDWSHLIVDETRELFFWSRAVQRILEVEQPAAVLVQRPSELRSSHRALRMIAQACRLIEHDVETWPPRQAR